MRSMLSYTQLNEPSNIRRITNPNMLGFKFCLGRLDVNRYTNSKKS